MVAHVATVAFLGLEARGVDVQGRSRAANGIRTNAEAEGDLLDEIATPDEPGRRLLAQAAEAMRLSARATTASFASPAPSPILREATASARSTSPKH